MAVEALTESIFPLHVVSPEVDFPVVRTNLELSGELTLLGVTMLQYEICPSYGEVTRGSLVSIFHWLLQMKVYSCPCKCPFLVELFIFSLSDQTFSITFPIAFPTDITCVSGCSFRCH